MTFKNFIEKKKFEDSLKQTRSALFDAVYSDLCVALLKDSKKQQEDLNAQLSHKLLGFQREVKAFVAQVVKEGFDEHIRLVVKDELSKRS